MVVCFDLRALQIGHQNRGIGMYIRSVLEHLPADDNHYLFYVFDQNDPITDLGIRPQIDYELVKTPTIKTALDSPKNILGLARLINHRFHPLKKFHPDVFVQFDFMLGSPHWRGTRKLVIGYDLIPLIMKNEYLPSLSFALKQMPKHHLKNPREIMRSVSFRIKNRSFSFGRSSSLKAKIRSAARSVYYRLRYRLHYKTFKRADKVISISEATSKDFTNILGIPKKRITTIPLAPVLPAGDTDISLAKQVHTPYIFYIGGTDSRKRIQDIVSAFNIVRGRGANLKLVLAGNEFIEVKQIPNIEGRNAIINSPYKNDIRLAGFVTDAQKMGLYQHAHAFVFCTIYEGFGLPIIEAMSASCPVISYNNSSIPEAAGDAALLVDTGDYVAIANNILTLYDPKVRDQSIKKGLLQAKKFNWATYTKAFRKTLFEF